MQKIIACFSDSAKESKTLRALMLTAMLIGLNLVLDRFSIQLMPQLRIGIGFLTSALIGMLFGPVMGVSAGLVTEVVSYLFNPRGAYFPGFTLTAMVAGLIYGVVFYQRKVSLPRAFAAKGLVNLICNICLNTLWLSMLQGDAIMAILPLRAWKNLILWPFESILLFIAARAVQEVYKKVKVSRA